MEGWARAYNSVSTYAPASVSPKKFSSWPIAGMLNNKFNRVECEDDCSASCDFLVHVVKTPRLHATYAIAEIDTG